jgi:cyanophycinase
VVVLPTAAAFDGADAATNPVADAARRSGFDPDVVPVLSRHDAERSELADRCAGAAAIVLVGESALHLRSVVKGTPVWGGVMRAWRAGSALVGVGWAGAALGDPMVDPRGGALTLGLGVIPFSFLPHADLWGADRTRRTLKMAKGVLVAVDSPSAAVWSPASGWADRSGLRAYRSGAPIPTTDLPEPVAGS